MSAASDVPDLLAEAALLLESGGAADWARALRRIGQEYEQDPVHGSAMLRGIYGGMGSFNDIVLVRDGVPLTEENDRLDEIREELFTLAR